MTPIPRLGEIKGRHGTGAAERGVRAPNRSHGKFTVSSTNRNPLGRADDFSYRTIERQFNRKVRTRNESSKTCLRERTCRARHSGLL